MKNLIFTFIVITLSVGTAGAQPVLATSDAPIFTSERLEDKKGTVESMSLNLEKSNNIDANYNESHLIESKASRSASNQYRKFIIENDLFYSKDSFYSEANAEDFASKIIGGNHSKSESDSRK